MGILLTSVIVLFNAAAWIGIFWLNGHVFSGLQEQIGVNWIFLPEGFLLLGVLLLGWRCCVGVFLGSFVAAYWLFAPINIWFIPIAATLAAFSPLLAIYMLKSRFPVKRDLSDMTALKLLMYGVVFSALSAIVHQLAFLFGLVYVTNPRFEEARVIISTHEEKAGEKDQTQASKGAGAVHGGLQQGAKAGVGGGKEEGLGGGRLLPYHEVIKSFRSLIDAFAAAPEFINRNRLY